MNASKRRRESRTVADFGRVMDMIAPTAAAQAWDNVGLLVGDPAARIRRVLLAIDLTPAVVEEAVGGKADLVMAYHPPLFKPISRLRADSYGTDAIVYRCARHGIAIYSTHTAMDAASGGTNDVIAELCGVTQAKPLEYVDHPGDGEVKVVVFVPAADLDRVAEAMFTAGAGHIGDYAHCSFRTEGLGTFLGGASTSPTVGKRGRLEQVDETRLEVVAPKHMLADVVAAMRATHSYEEPAFDVYPLVSQPAGGIGRVGMLKKPVALATLARRLKKATMAACVQVVGDPRRQVDRAVVAVGAAGSLPFRSSLGARDVIVTGEIRHHDALAFDRTGAAAIALGHWASERPALAKLAQRLATELPGIDVSVSAADSDPFRPG